MASKDNRGSNFSNPLRGAVSSRRDTPKSVKQSDRPFCKEEGRVTSSKRATNRSKSEDMRLSSVRVGDINRSSRAQREKKPPTRYLKIAGTVVAAVCVLVFGGFIVSNSSFFLIKGIEVEGVEHLTTEDMQNLVEVPKGSTLFNVNTAGVEKSILRDAWVEDVSVSRKLPDTLKIKVIERKIQAVVEVPSEDGSVVQDWFIAADGTWLMPIPAQDSEAGQRTSLKVYEDVESALRITNVSHSTAPEIGKTCSDGNVNNALAVVSGMTTELADRVVSVKAEDPEAITVTIEDGPDIVFGTADNLRDKERVCREIMEKHSEGVAYINVRTVDRPTWRSV